MRDFPKEEAEGEFGTKFAIQPEAREKDLFKHKEKTFRRLKKETPSHHFCIGHKPAVKEMQKKRTKLKEERRKRGPNLTTFLRKQPLRITFLFFKRKQERENFSTEI